MDPSDIPAELHFTMVKLFSSTTTTIEEVILSPSEALHDLHADNMFGWSLKSRRGQHVLEAANMQRFRTAPSYEAVCAEKSKRDAEIQARKEEQEARERMNAAKPEVEKPAQVVQGGKLGRMHSQAAASVSHGTGHKRIPPAAAAGGAVQATGTAGSAKAARKAPHTTSAAVPAPRSGAGGQGKRRAVAEHAASIANKPAQMVGSSMSSTQEPSTPPSKTVLPVTLWWLGKARKGSMGRALQPVDLAAVMFGFKDPGRELAASYDRMDELNATKDNNAINLEEEFQDGCVAAKTWTLSNIPFTRSTELRDTADVLDRLGCKIPFQHQLQLTKKIVTELGHTKDWAKWARMLKPDTSLKTPQWKAKEPRFTEIESLSTEHFELYKTTWLDAAFSNGMLQAINDISESSWEDFKNMSDAWFQLDVLEGFDPRTEEVMQPFNSFLLGIRAVSDPMPFACNSAPADVDFVWPTTGCGEDDETAKSFSQAVPNGRLIMRSVSKNTALGEKLVDWKKVAGAEATVGREWSQLQVQLEQAAAFQTGEITPNREEEEDKILAKFLELREDVSKRLRTGATDLTDAAVATIMRGRWKRIEPQDTASVSATLQSMLDICKLLPSLSGLDNTIKIRLEERTHSERQTALTSSLTLALVTFDQCNQLRVELDKARNTPKTDEQLENLRQCLAKVHLLAAAEIQKPNVDVDEFNSAISLFKAILAERGVVGTDLKARKAAEGASRFLELLRDWRRESKALQSGNPTRIKVMGALEIKKSLDNFLEKADWVSSIADPAVCKSYQVGTLIYAHAVQCLMNDIAYFSPSRTT